MPIKNLILETGTFDMHLMKNPKMNRHWGYQRGVNYGFSKTREKVLFRDNHICQACSGKSKDSKLEVHHIIFRSNGGSDEEDNLITLCKTCHDKVHKGLLNLSKTGKYKGTLKHASQMNILRNQLLLLYEDRCIETFGYITKTNRLSLGLPKDHNIDACIIASGGNKVYFKNNVVYVKRNISKGDYQKTSGTRSEKSINQRKICGFKKYDKIRYLGKEYFIKGRMSSGYAVLMDIYGNKVDFSNMPKGMKTPKLVNCSRISSRKTTILTKEYV